MTDSKLIKQVKKLKTSTVPGRSHDGAKVRIEYHAFRPSTEEARSYAAQAVSQGMDKDVYTGVLDKMWTTPHGEFCITVLTMERLHNGKYGFRTFNLTRGKVTAVQVLNP